MQKTLSYLWALAALIPLATVNIFQMLSIILYPFSRPLFFRVNINFAIAVWSWWAIMIERIHGTKIIVSGDDLPMGESAVVFANHQCQGDIVMLLAMAKRSGRMGIMRWMVKDEMRFVPFVGWGMLFLDFLFLKRDWAKDRERIQATFSRLRERTAPVWLVLFPEGTRKTPAKHAASMAHARKASLTETPHVMIPRTKGFVASVQGLLGKIEAVYRIVIIYPPPRAPSLLELFSGQVREVKIMVTRHLLPTIPLGEKDLSDWLVREFVGIDAVLSRETTTSTAPGR